MKYLKLTPLLLAVAFLLYFFFGASKSNNQTSQSPSTSQSQWETKTNDQPPVSLKITPLELGLNAKIWKFAVIFDAHSGSLDDDPLRVTQLADDNGKTYAPTTWEGAGPGGHHREGMLIFNAIQPFPKYVELRVKNVGGIPVRSFRWDMR